MDAATVEMESTVGADAEFSGWIIDVDQPGAGWSRTLHGHRELPNGRWLLKRVYYPSPFLSIAEPDKEHPIEENVTVYTDRCGAANPPEPPAGATLKLVDYDGEEEWFADFGDDEEAAERYALSLPLI